MNAVQFAERHEEKMMIPEADDLGEREAIVPRGFDSDDFTDRCERAFGFDHKPDYLDDATAGFRHTRLTHAIQRGTEPARHRNAGFSRLRRASASSCRLKPAFRVL
jgi:hypothetical protein